MHIVLSVESDAVPRLSGLNGGPFQERETTRGRNRQSITAYLAILPVLTIAIPYPILDP